MHCILRTHDTHFLLLPWPYLYLCHYISVLVYQRRSLTESTAVRSADGKASGIDIGGTSKSDY